MSNLKRFVDAQEGEWGYETALEEMKAGRKRTHWMWYIFPQIKGLGRSYKAEYYGIKSLYEARQYMEYGKLGRRLREITHAVVLHDTTPIEEIMGGRGDARKFRSSMTLFDIVCPGECFERALEVFFDGERDMRTLAVVEKERAYLYGDSAFVQAGISGYYERGYFEGGVVESDEIPAEIKLPTVLGFILNGQSMADMVHHYLYHKDFSHYRLSGVESRLEWYRNRLLNELVDGVNQSGQKVLQRVAQKLERTDLELGSESDIESEVEHAANAFDFVVLECANDEYLKERMMQIASSINRSEDVEDCL